MKLLLTTNLI